MKYFIFFIVSSLFITLFVVTINLPLSVIKPLLSENFPEITYSKIEGTIWSGEISDLSFANEYLGDLKTETDLRSLEFYLNDNEVLVEGKLNLIGTLIERRINLREVNFEIGSSRFLQRIPSISVRTAYRWIRYNERDFGKNDPTSRECITGKTTAKLIDEINNEMEQDIDDKGDLPSKIPRIKELTELLQKLKKLQKS